MTDDDSYDLAASIKQSVMASNSSHLLAETTLLHQTIKQQIDATDRQSSVMTRLTWAAVALAVIQVIAAIIQVWLSFRQCP